MQNQDRQIEGFVYLVGESRRSPARLDIADYDEELWVRVLTGSGEELARAPLESVKIDSPLGRTDRKLTFPNGTLFECSDHMGFAELDRDIKVTILHRLEGFGIHLVGFAIASLVAAILIWRYGLDILVSVAIWMTPPALVAQIDAGSTRTIDLLIAEESALTDAQIEFTSDIYTDLILALPAHESDAHEFRLLFRSMPGLGPNALALPGGTMIVTDALVQQFPDQDVLAGVIAHEIGHVVEEHGLRRLYRSLSTYLIIAIIAGDTGAILDEILLEGNVLLSLSHSRKQETAADKFGLNLSYNAGFDPAGLKIFFETISHGEPTGGDWASTHPSHENRVEAIDAFIEEFR